ncbi:hypothetical protein Y032_0083g1620 [Ancylostoma ceylanicum]|uniref:Ig-like domain-containing protein n=1 Tax=Ancylostoma ceylanicum TaxID=53326 RepID=A0A016TR94_9BILA|nr:hypothetical protein Y032_0083g1620 [Ancylostoma ceylanicum]
MRWLVVVFLVEVTLAKCPSRCTCKGDSMSCVSLNENELSIVISHLSSAEWSGLRELSIRNTSSLSIDRIPKLDYLEVFDLSSNNFNDDVWLNSKVAFPNVRKVILEFNNFTRADRRLLTPFPRIEEVHLGHNNISYIGYDSLRMPQIRTIRLNDNNIKVLGMYAFRFIPQLQEVDLSGNLIERFMMSEFSTATSLRYLNVSRNKIRSVECDSITPMLSLEVLDLSSNNLTHLPGLELRSMESLRTLILARNPITVVEESQIRLDGLQMLDLSSSALRVVEAGAFSRLPRLHSVNFGDCRDLIFVSPAAFENISVFSLDISGTGVKSLPPSLLSSIARIRISNVPLDCGCLSEQLSFITTTTITDWSNSTCVTRRGEVLSIPSLSPTNLASTEQCRPSVILPFGDEVIANVGQTFKIYCAGTDEDDVVKWKTPQGELELASRPEFSSGFERLDYFTTTLFEPLKRQRPRKRTLATTEYFRIDVVLNSDAGDYECTIQRGKYTFTRKIRLIVRVPDIQLKVTHVGVSSVHLAWSQNIDIQAVDRVALQVNSTSATDFKRVVLLSLHNIYCSYNLINLLPDRAYTICLRWSLTDDGTDIYSTCLSERTQKSRSFMEDIGAEGVAVICAILILMFVFFCGRWTYNRYHIYLRTRQQSKMIQSVSGQSVLSQRSSDDAITFENHQLQMCSSFCDRDSMANGPLLINVT